MALSLTVTRASATSFIAAISGTSGATVSLYYLQHDGPTMGAVQGPSTRTGDGSITVSSLTPNAHYSVYAVTGSSPASYSLPAFQFVALSSPDTVIGAIRRRWNALPGLMAIAGRIYTNEVPERDESGNKLSPPYTFCNLGRSTFDWTFEREYIESNVIDFHVFTVGAANAEEAENQVRLAFDFQALPFLDGEAHSTIVVTPTDSLLVCENVRHKDGGMIWRTEVCYRVAVQNRLPTKPAIKQPISSS